MTSRSFFERGEGLSLSALAALCDAVLADPAHGDRRISSIASIDEAGTDELAFFDNPNYASALSSLQAGAVVTSQRFVRLMPTSIPLLIAKDPQRAFGLAGRALHQDAVSPSGDFVDGTISPRAVVHPTAKLEDGVTVEPFAVVESKVSIGRGTIISSGASVGAGCQIGRDCRIGQQVRVQHALLGNGVILHPGVKIGQDGFGYALGASGILKMVQIGRVIIQDNVEVGSNSTIDRGAVRDTVIGENTKIDNLVQIAHNVVIGRNCFIVGQVGIAGSATIGNGVAIGGQTGVNGHITIGDGAQIAAVSVVAGDVPPGSRWGGIPARPVREWIRELAVMRELTKARRGSARDDGSSNDA